MKMLMGLMMITGSSVANAAMVTETCGQAETVIASKDTWGAINPDVYGQLQMALDRSDKETVGRMARQGMIWPVPMRSLGCVLLRVPAYYRVQVSIKSGVGNAVPVPIWVDDRVFPTVE